MEIEQRSLYVLTRKFHNATGQEFFISFRGGANNSTSQSSYLVDGFDHKLCWKILKLKIEVKGPPTKMSKSSSGSSSHEKRSRFDDAMKEIKEIEKKDSVLTSKHQIERLLRPGSTYFNLNPFEVLHIDEETTPVEDIKRKYKRLSILCHPDKNQDDVLRAQTAFEIINRAWKILENDVTRKKCLDVYQEAKERTDLQLVEKRKKLKKEGRSSDIPEDDPEMYKRAKYVLVMKLFADMERKRQQLDVRDQEERKRKREQEIEEEETKQVQKEFAKNFEESRQDRVNSWHDFQSGKKKKAKKSKPGPTFNPPKVKAETRNQST